MLRSYPNNQSGLTPLILLLIAGIGLLSFLILSNTADFQGGLFKNLFAKRNSFAADPGVAFVDSKNAVITTTNSPTVKLQLTSPWSVKNQGGFTLNLVPETHAQTGTQTSVTATGNANVDGSSVVVNQNTIWLGNAGSASSSYTGIVFAGVRIPKNAKITSAKIQVYSTQSQWISVKADINGALSSTGTFSQQMNLSQLQMTSAKIAHSSNSKWDQNKQYDFSDVTPIVQELVNRSEWNSGANVALIMKGTGTSYGRKVISGTGANSPKLMITYSVDGTGTPATPNPTPVSTTSPTQAPQVTVVSAKIAEDNGFSRNVKDINPFGSNPMVVDYTFSDSNPGTKTVFVKYVSSTGEERSYSKSILLSAQATPMPSHIHGGTEGNSYAIGMWNPNPKFDTCTSAADTARIKEIHDSYKVQGPDGKWYPTWHPPVDPKTGCKFGHEHGRDPSQSMVWKQVKEYFYFDENKNNAMDAAEEAVAGLPFGYTNEQYDIYLASKGQSGMRHEDHVGHKVDYANDETEIATHQMSTQKNGGVWIGDANESGKISPDTGVRCFFLAKPHQGVSSKDAFTNNIHEVFYFQDCRHLSRPDLNAKVSVAMMEGFGAPGGFTNFMPMCKIERRSNPQDRVCPLGKDSSGNCILDSVNQTYPTDDGDREIITRQCIEKGFLVPQGTWSGNLYEAWPASLQVVRPNGANIVSGINLLFDVEDANRYYWPGKPNNVGYTMELCYDQSLASQGRIYRGGPCDYSTNYGQIKNITWDDPRSGFKGTNRGMYFQSAVISNGGGTQVWYTDPFGKNASTTPFAGSVKQIIESKNVNYGSLITGGSIDPRVNNRQHSDGNGTVHAPN